MLSSLGLQNKRKEIIHQKKEEVAKVITVLMVEKEKHCW